MNISFNHHEWSNASLNESIAGILERNYLCSIATCTAGHESYIHTAYFAFSNQLHLFFMSDPSARHSQNIESNQTAAVAVADSRQPWDEEKQGVQLFGTCEVASGKLLVEAELQYVRRFVSYRNWLNALTKAQRKAFTSRFYVFRTSALKLFDEPAFGEETFVELTLPDDQR